MRVRPATDRLETRDAPKRGREVLDLLGDAMEHIELRDKGVAPPRQLDRHLGLIRRDRVPGDSAGELLGLAAPGDGPNGHETLSQISIGKWDSAGKTSLDLMHVCSLFLPLVAEGALGAGFLCDRTLQQNRHFVKAISLGV